MAVLVKMTSLSATMDVIIFDAPIVLLFFAAQKEEQLTDSWLFFIQNFKRMVTYRLPWESKSSRYSKKVFLFSKIEKKS